MPVVLEIHSSRLLLRL